MRPIWPHSCEDEAFSHGAEGIVSSALCLQLLMSLPLIPLVERKEFLSGATSGSRAVALKPII